MALMTDEEFSAFCKAKYCSPTSGLEGGKRIEMLEELARKVYSFRPWSSNGESERREIVRILDDIGRDNERVARLEQKYDKEFCENLEQLRPRTLFPEKT